MRGYIVAAERHGISAGEALRMLVEGKLPSFVTDKMVPSVKTDKLAA
jgi:hypothetical protein